MRFDTSMVMAERPLTRVIEIASLKVGLIWAMSASVTDADDDATSGTFKMSCGRSNSDGTLTVKRPDLAFQRAGGDQRVEGLRHLPQCVERDAIARASASDR